MPNYPLFSVMGIEIEYMIVDQHSLDIQPKCDQLIQQRGGIIQNALALTPAIALSNELVLHVLELKNDPPTSPGLQMIDDFQTALLSLQPLLQANHLCLLPTASHPWMNPQRETCRWPHDNHAIYQTFDRIFNCHGHGWSNLQSMHINLPFANDHEFSLLHNAIRLLLPLLPALAASSPLHEGRPTGFLDTRLCYYNQNQAKIPSISGDIIPPFITSEDDYRHTVLAPMMDDIKPFDPQGILQHDWLNSRGAIPKFDCQAIEIRLLDTQECVSADLSLAMAIFHILKAWCHQAIETPIPPCDTQRLKALYLETLKTGLNTPLSDPTLLNALHLPSHVRSCRAAWEALLDTHGAALPHTSQRLLENILTQGNLSERILKRAGQTPSRARLTEIYRDLAQCLLHNTPYHPS